MRRKLAVIAITAVSLCSPLIASAASIAAETVDDAVAAYRARDWDKAAALLRPIAEENPYSGRYWFMLAGALHSAGQFEAAIPAYEKAIALGFQKPTALYNLACCESLLGRKEAAVDHVEAAIRARIQDRENLIRTDSDLDNIRDTEAFRSRILPAVSAEMPRVDGWRIDLDYLHKRMEETHYDLYRNISREDWRAEIDRLKSNVDTMTDQAIVVDLMILFARIGDGHTGVTGPMDGFYRGGAVALETWHAIPVDFYVFSDGLFVRAAAGAYGEIVGKRVVRIGSLGVDEVLSRCATVTQRDNTQQIKWIAPRYMSVVEILHRLGVISDTETVAVTVSDDSGQETTAHVKPLAFDMSIMHRDYENKVSMLDADMPLYMTNKSKHYWADEVAEDNLIYVGFNSVRNIEGESLADFSAGVLDYMEKKNADALVIDVRDNNGGNNFLTLDMIDAVAAEARVNKRGHLFVITGRETFSAAQNFVNRMQTRTEAIFVGEATGSKPNFVGETNRIILPYTGLEVRGSSRYWQDTLSEDQRPWVAPDLAADLSSSDFRSGRDPAMAVIAEYLRQRRSTGMTGKEQSNSDGTE